MDRLRALIGRGREVVGGTRGHHIYRRIGRTTKTSLEREYVWGKLLSTTRRRCADREKKNWGRGQSAVRSCNTTGWFGSTVTVCTMAESESESMRRRLSLCGVGGGFLAVVRSSDSTGVSGRVCLPSKGVAAVAAAAVDSAAAEAAGAAAAAEMEACAASAADDAFLLFSFLTLSALTLAAAVSVSFFCNTIHRAGMSRGG